MRMTHLYTATPLLNQETLSRIIGIKLCINSELILDSSILILILNDSVMSKGHSKRQTHREITPNSAFSLFQFTRLVL